MEKPKIVSDLLAVYVEGLVELHEDERPDLVAFGPATFTELKHCRRTNTQPKELPTDVEHLSFESIYGIKYQAEADIPFGEFRYMKWVTEGGERKLRVVKTIYVRRTSMTSTLHQPEPHPNPATIDEMDTFLK